MKLSRAYVLTLTGVIITPTILATTAGRCNNPTEIGELRNWADKSQCIDPSGMDGHGNVNTYLCDGHEDQTFLFCEDGTIRSSKSGFCLDVDGYDGVGNVQMWPCEAYPTVKEDQQWYQEPIDGTFVDSGILQDLFMIRNKQSGLCLDIASKDGSGEVGVYACDGGVDQHFYIRNRGEVKATGKLQNQKSGQCLDVEGSYGIGNVLAYKCEDRADQVFTLYENGELVNKASNQCVDISGYEGTGNVGIYPCEAISDQQWKQVLWSGDYFSLVSKKSDQCIDVSGYDGEGDIGTWRCESVPDQSWKFIPEKWTTPVGKWNMVFCNTNGGISFSMTSAVSSTETLTEEASVEIGTEISADMIFASSSVSISVSSSIANEWSSTSSSENTVSVSCDKYDDKTAFTGGCMWQWHMEISSSENNVLWDAGIARCTRSADSPKCPPFMICANEMCSECIDEF